jgi:rhodanese-related sulfurtransferase
MQMKKLLVISLAVMMALAFAGFAFAADSPVVAGEKKVHAEFVKMIPKDKYRTVDDMYKKWQEVLAGKSAAYLLDVRTHPEFDAFHIEGSCHIHAGHMYTIPKKIKDPNAEIWVYCRTQHRAGYVAGFLYKYGYKNVYFVHKAKDGTAGGITGWVKRGYPIVNYWFGYVDKTGMHYSKPPLKERKGKSFVREFMNQRGEL